MGILRLLVKILAPLLTIAAGVGAMLLLVKTKPVPHKEALKDLGTLVQVQRVKVRRQPLVIQAQGSVTPARQVLVQPEVQGRVTWKHMSLVPGGRFRKGEVLLRIDPRQYAMEAQQRQVSIQQAEELLTLERARREIAKQEWQIIGQDGEATADGRAVALREPQLRQAEASLKTAETAASLARLNLGRTTLTAPFNGLVQETTIDVGQLVSPQSAVATLVGTDVFWVKTSIPVSRLGKLQVPGLNADAKQGSEALVWQDVGGKRIEKRGRVVRLLGDLDPVGRMARVLVAIDDPLGLSAGAEKPTAADANHEGDGEMPLLIGAYVHVEISANELVDVVPVPRRALRQGNQVHVVSEQNTLSIREVNIVWRTAEEVFVDRGLKSDERVVVSHIPSPIERMKLRVQSGAPRVGQVDKPAE